MIPRTSWPNLALLTHVLSTVSHVLVLQRSSKTFKDQPERTGTRPAAGIDDSLLAVSSDDDRHSGGGDDNHHDNVDIETVDDAHGSMTTMVRIKPYMRECYIVAHALNLLFRRALIFRVDTCLHFTPE